MEKSKSPFFVSVVIPIQKFDDSVSQKILAIQEDLNQNYWDYEIILVGSQEIYKNNLKKLIGFLDEVPSVRYLQLAASLSKEAKLECGAENSIGDFVVLFNLETDPVFLIREGIEKSSKGSDVLIGISKFNTSILYNLGRRFIKFLLNLSEYRLPKDATDFRVLSRRAVNATFFAGKQSQDFFMRIQNSGFDYKPISYELEKGLNKNLREGAKKTLDLMVVLY